MDLIEFYRGMDERFMQLKTRTGGRASINHSINQSINQSICQQQQQQQQIKLHI